MRRTCKRPGGTNRGVCQKGNLTVGLQAGFNQRGGAPAPPAGAPQQE